MKQICVSDTVNESANSAMRIYKNGVYSFNGNSVSFARIESRRCFRTRRKPVSRLLIIKTMITFFYRTRATFYVYLIDMDVRRRRHKYRCFKATMFEKTRRFD